MFPEYSISMDTMSLPMGILTTRDILYPSQQDEKHPMELAQYYQIGEL